MQNKPKQPLAFLFGRLKAGLFALYSVYETSLVVFIMVISVSNVWSRGNNQGNLLSQNQN
jgi:hypothetical protein